MKRLSILLLGILLFVTSCAPDVQEDEEVVKDNEQQEETSIVPSNQLSKDNYRVVLPYRVSAARGVITNQLANRLDIDEMEEGLRRLAKDYYSPDDYYFEEGQYLSESTVYGWLGRTLTKKELEKEVKKEVDKRKKNEMNYDEEQIKKNLQQGLNPSISDDEDKKAHKENPKYLSHILEHNFLVKNDDDTVSLNGISIGLAMKSVYRYQTEEGGPYYYEDISKKQMLKKGYELADTIVERMRGMEGLEDIPIMVAIYREAEQSSPIPGNFVARGFVDSDSDSVKKWEDINEEFVLFPSDDAKEDHFDDYQTVNNFGEEIAKYFPNYVGVVGEGFYYDGDLKQLTLEIPIEFFGKGEVIGFTQYAYGLVQDMFSDYYDLEIKITSSQQVESFISKEAGEKEPTVHIFH
ncbi:CamS family sex pheromone protein [Virgibacillus sp. MSJ-26]|uniref:CamS family sex pheromone protein n=1 Tax=Virgibacillus sp. MSJ-26 TaxID=2841522 RepID=UPI001C11E517|nr:CamS family sex pheromone protein [Virgibacillus sp. MSJ-26]MBU5467961.1 CamS family sex pheromone protein [Virgibacillus sp. MSJ-26]